VLARSRGAEAARALPLPDEGARAGPGPALGALKVKNIRAAIYDGDTESERRWQIRKWSNLILTNPDMLHVGVLPHHDRWGDVPLEPALRRVDEAHVYRGVFGSHVANVLRRLPRLPALRSEPQFLLASRRSRTRRARQSS
jgi:DEAD/DEAH box helicase domain-containing protein